MKKYMQICKCDEKAVILLITFMLSLLLTVATGSTLYASGRDETPVSYIPVNIGDVAQDAVRGTRLYHHNNQVEQLWYGTDRWAVKFDIEDYTASTDSLTLEKVDLYFPNEAGSFSLKVYTDKQQPLDSLAVEYTNQPVSQGWNQVEFNEEEYVTAPVFWIVIDYITNNTNRFMAASATGGEHSYYWVPEREEIPAHFANMSENNAVCEFLVTLSGQLVVEGVDLELVSFSLQGDIERGGTVYPEIEVKNNSSEYFSDRVFLAVDVVNSTDEEIYFRDRSFQLDAAPGETVKIDEQLSGQTAQLLNEECQYEFTATLVSRQDPFTGNNVIKKSLEFFSYSMDEAFVENLVRFDHRPSDNILNIQQELQGYPFQYINYFFHAEDTPYYNRNSALRRDFYRLIGYPFTVINGVNSIAGYDDNYQKQLQQFIDISLEENTFITLYRNERHKLIDTFDMQLTLEFAPENRYNDVFSRTVDNLQLFVALTEKNVDGVPGNVLLYLYSHHKKLALGRREYFDFKWNINLHTVDTVQREINRFNLSHFNIISWIQDMETGRVYFVRSFELDNFELDVEKTEPSAESSVSIKPNPFSGRGNVNISSENTGSTETVITKATVYNIKGQAIKEIDGSHLREIEWDGVAGDGTAASSGIYFIRVNRVRKTPAGEVVLNPKIKRLSIIR